MSKKQSNRRPGIPVILFTGYSEGVSEHRAAQLGIDRFLMKPVIKADVANTLRELLDGREGRSGGSGEMS